MPVKVNGVIQKYDKKMLKAKKFTGRQHTKETRQKMSIAKLGEKHPMYGKTINENTRNALSIANKNKVYTEEYRNNLSLSGKNRVFTETHKENISNSLRKYVASCYPSGPRYNKRACIIFEEINKELGWSGRHAENGGEFLIKELGYWVDFYEPNLNIIIEFDEKNHKYKRNHDLIRQKRIIDLLGCKFYRISEGDEWRMIIT